MIFLTTNTTGTIDLPKNAPEGDILVEVKKATEKNIRTSKQNRSLHKFFTDIASAMNGDGRTFTCLISGVKYNYTPELVKNTLWKPLQVSLTGKESTTQLTTIELHKIQELVQIAIRDMTNIWVDFPSEDSMRIQYLIHVHD